MLGQLSAEVCGTVERVQVLQRAKGGQALLSTAWLSPEQINLPDDGCTPDVPVTDSAGSWLMCSQCFGCKCICVCMNQCTIHSCI